MVLEINRENWILRGDWSGCKSCDCFLFNKSKSLLLCTIMVYILSVSGEYTSALIS